MESAKILTAGITGTSAMTLFSYLTSEAKEKNFKEPELLASLLQRLMPEMEKEYALPSGWAMHYGMGVIFTTIYHYLWKETKLKPTLKNGILIGGISGLAGILVWKLTFKLHPNPPLIHFKKYYGHLLLAHVIFGAFAIMGYNLVRKRQKNFPKV